MRLNLGGFDKRKLARIVAVVAVALAAGHLVQTVAAGKMAAKPRVAQTDVARPKAVVQLAATNVAISLPTVVKPPMAAERAMAPYSLRVAVM